MANEKRLIDANALKNEMLEENPYIHFGPFGYCACSPKTDGELVFKREDVLRAIDSAPTEDAVVLPCKIGQTVYVINGLWVSNYMVTHFWYDGFFFKFKAINEEYAYECRDFSFFDERIGKTVFFTYEQAELALKKMYGGNDDGKSL